MLFFASWIFLGQADFETFSFALLSLFVPRLALMLFLFFSGFLFIRCDLTKPAILFFIEFQTQLLCNCWRQGKRGR